MTNSKKYNALPIEVRRITNNILAEHQLRDLNIERNRAIKAHKNHLREIDAHIKNVERSLEELLELDRNEV